MAPQRRLGGHVDQRVPGDRRAHNSGGGGGGRSRLGLDQHIGVAAGAEGAREIGPGDQGVLGEKSFDDRGNCFEYEYVQENFQER